MLESNTIANTVQANIKGLVGFGGVGGGLLSVDIVIVAEVFLCMTEPVFEAGQSGWHMGTAKPVTQIEATIHDSVSEWRLVLTSATHTVRGNIYSGPHTL